MRPALRAGWIPLIALLCCGPGLSAHALTPTVEEYAVLSAVIAHGLPPDTKTIAISAQTTGKPDTVVPPGADLQALATTLETTPTLLYFWTNLNRQTATLEAKFTLKTRVELVDDALRAKIFADDDPGLGWERFHKRFPHAPGLLSVSRVALDDAHANALVYVEFACGPACGTGRLIRLSRVNATWAVLSGELMWVAGE